MEQTLVLGRFTPADLVVSISESTRKIDDEVEGQIDTLWDATEKKAKEEGRVCYDGISYRLNSLEKDGNTVRIDLGLLQYRVRIGLKSIPKYHTLSEEYYHKGCYTSATVKTSDGFYLVVELSGKSMNMNVCEVLGGIMEKPSHITTGEDIFECLYEELAEEACIKKSDILESYVRAIFITPATHACFYFEVSLVCTSKEILESFMSENEDKDIQHLKVLTKEEYLTFLSHSSPTKLCIREYVTI